MNDTEHGTDLMPTQEAPELPEAWSVDDPQVADSGRLTNHGRLTTWRDIADHLTPQQISILTADQAAGHSGETLLWNARQMAEYNLWEILTG
jgi:hypothetical protein